MARNNVCGMRPSYKNGRKCIHFTSIYLKISSTIFKKLVLAVTYFVENVTGERVEVKVSLYINV